VIQSFKDDDAKELFESGKNRRWANIANVARRKLLMVHTAQILSDLKAPPNNQLEVLKKDRKGQHAIRINDQYRVCFEWKADGPHNVEITDYH
jgi:toxin HigB-1